MPELPDIVVYIEALRARLPGQPLERIRLGNPFIIRTIEPAPKDHVLYTNLRDKLAAESPVARYVAKWVESFPLWDEIAAAVWLEPSLVSRTEKLAVGVDTGGDGAGYGNTLSWPAGQGPGRGERDIEVVFDVDVPRLEQLVLARLTAAAPADGR